MTRHMSQDLDLVHQQYVPDEPAPDEGYPTVIALHGRGSYAGDLLELAPFFGSGWMTIAPQAPFGLSIGPERGYYWYEMLEVGNPEPQEFAQSLELLQQFVAKLPQAYPVDQKRIFLLGFSQGAVMSYALGLTEPQRYAGIAALSGYIAPQTQHDAAKDKLAGLPIFLTHGTYDDIIPASFGRAARDWLQGMAAEVDYYEYPIGHHIHQNILARIIHGGQVEGREPSRYS
jgi:phospholipase/carboxylesterase